MVGRAKGKKNNKDKEGECVELQVEGEAKEEAKGNGERGAAVWDGVLGAGDTGDKRCSCCL